MLHVTDSTPLLQSKRRHIHPWSSTAPITDIDDYTHTSATIQSNGTSLLNQLSSQDSVGSTNFTLGLYLFGAVFVAVANNITWKSTLDRFKSVQDSNKNLEFFVNQFTVALYVLMAAVVLIHRQYNGYISEQQKLFPTHKFTLMGLFDAMAGLCSAIGCASTSGSIQTLCNQAAIPSTMLMSRIFLQSMYSTYQYLGAVLIMIGALSASIPAAHNNSSSDGTTLLGLLVLGFSIIPSSFSNVYKESNFKTQGLDVYYLTVYVSIFQVLLGFVFMPVLALPGFGGMNISDVPQNFMDGWNCFLGNYVVDYTCHTDQPPYIPLLLYVVVNFAYNTLLLLITKHGSALLLVISSALSLPLTNLLFTQSLFMGQHAESFSVYNLIGLVIVVTGFLLYSLAPDVSDDSEFMPATGAGGQMIYITDDSQRLPHNIYNRRRASFDINTIASYQAIRDQFKQKYKTNKSDILAVHGSYNNSTDATVV